MLKCLLLASAFVFTAVAPVQALPVCYWVTADGQQVDLSYMCGAEGTAAVPTAVVLSSNVGQLPDVWTRNIHFLANGSTITGNIHNSGTALAQNVIVEATGYAEGRTPQTRQVTVPLIGADDAVAATVDFGFSVPVNSWDVRVVSWD